METVESNGLEGILSIKENVRILLWYDNKHTYFMASDIIPDEMLKIAGNITFPET